MERGIRRQEIFQDEFDYQVFLEILRKESEQKKCMIHAYCLMTNHFHLLAETQTIEIRKFMIGEPGCGKTMIAQRIPTILPEMTEEECLEVTKIYSIYLHVVVSKVEAQPLILVLEI